VKKFPLSSRRLTITALLFVVALLVSVSSYSFFATTRKANASALSYHILSSLIRNTPSWCT